MAPASFAAVGYEGVRRSFSILAMVETPTVLRRAHAPREGIAFPSMTTLRCWAGRCFLRFMGATVS